jgi:hypothetical protein
MNPSPSLMWNIPFLALRAETTASVNFPIGLGHGSSMVDDDAPWSAGGTFGKTGQPSGIFNTYAIPFSTIRVTVTLLSTAASTALDSTRTTDSANVSTAGTTSFWIILRGHTLLSTDTNQDVPANFQFTLPGSGIALPAAARMRTHENVAVALNPGDYLDIMVSSAAGGTVFMVVLEVDTAGGMTFLEGCFRVTDPVTNSTRMLLSSGTEDYFLGTYCKMHTARFLSLSFPLASLAVCVPKMPCLHR